MGKTTCAAAFAVASARSGHATLLVSTDPAPSAGDAFRQPLTASPRAIKGTAGRLHAVEVNAPKALERWLAPRRAVLEPIALRGTWLDQDDVAALLRLSLPGIDEIAALMEIGRLDAAGRYDHIVVDTAPTGHTLRMLAMPRFLATLAEVFDRMQGKHRAIVEALRGRWTPEESDNLIVELDDEAGRLAELLSDATRSAVSWITLPEPMAVAESADGLRELRRLGLQVDRIVVNRVTPPPDRPCRWCTARRAFERGAIDALRAAVEDASPPFATVVARPREPRGVAALSAIAAEMNAPPRLPPRRALARGVAAEGIPAGKPLPVAAGDGRGLLLFGGKGGVGKTTCAAAAAIAAAAEQPKRSVLLLSADPAHSLGDVLGIPLSDEPRNVPGAPANLKARELDPEARFAALKTRYVAAIDALFERLLGGTGGAALSDRQSMRDLMELAPPGLDELSAIVVVSDALEAAAAADPARHAPLVVLDTAPTGHALRLLEMPALVHDWVKALMGILLKYQPVVGIGELGAVLLQMSQGLGRLRALLADPSRAAFTVVTRAADLPAAETTRLLARLRALHIHVPAIVVNALGAGTCTFCMTTRKDQQRALSALRRSLRGRNVPNIIVTPGVIPPPHGPKALQTWRASWATRPAGR